MKGIGIAIIASLLLIGCKSDPKEDSEIIAEETSKTQKFATGDCPEYLQKNKSTNLNISILLDLSSRIEENNQYLDDIEYLKTISQEFVSNVENKKTILTNDKIQLFFDPIPESREIQNLTENLRYEFTRENILIEQLADLKENYANNPAQLYKTAMVDAKKRGGYAGSDTWRFFKDKVNDYTIDGCSRNILVILTDGYLFYDGSDFKEDNLTSFILPRTLPRDLNSSQWEKTFEDKNYGFIPANSNLNDLEVLVLGIRNQNKNNPYTLDILEKYWGDWFENMGVKKYKVKEADIPSNVEKVIRDFI